MNIIDCVFTQASVYTFVVHLLFHWCQQALVGLAEEIANFDVPLRSTRKINGKYIQSLRLSRLEGKLQKGACNASS